MFVFLTHFPQISEEENLARLEKVIRFLRDEGAWFPTMAELSEWWLARAAVDFRTGREGETLIIRCDNPTAYRLREYQITVKDPALRRWRLLAGEGMEPREGEIPPSRRFLVEI